MDVELPAVEQDRQLPCRKKRGEEFLEDAMNHVKLYGASCMRTVPASSTAPTEERVNFAVNEKTKLIFS